jgi:cation:H+ antiporter
MIPLIAILFGGGVESSHIGVGAILGAPFMLSTLAMFVTGVAVLVVARKRSTADVMLIKADVLAHDMRFFAIAYALAVGVAFVPSELAWPRWVAAAALLGIYAYYVREHFVSDSGGNHGELAALRLHRLDRWAPRGETRPRLRIVSAQVLVALGCIILGAAMFVGAVEHVATAIGADSTLLALLVAPIATELPEKFNSVIWVRQGKDTLAMGNITGAMVFQSTIPTVVALVFASSHWAISADSTVAFISAGIAFASSAVIFIPMARTGRLLGRWLLLGGGFYLAYVALVVASLSGRPA